MRKETNAQEERQISQGHISTTVRFTGVLVFGLCFTILGLCNAQFNREGVTRSFLLFYQELLLIKKISMETFTANYQNLNLYFCQSHSPPHPLGWRMRILFGVLIYSTFLCDKENPFPTKLKLPFHPNKY